MLVPSIAATCTKKALSTQRPAKPIEIITKVSAEHLVDSQALRCKPDKHELKHCKRVPWLQHGIYNLKTPKQKKHKNSITIKTKPNKQLSGLLIEDEHSLFVLPLAQHSPNPKLEMQLHQLLIK